MPINTFTSRLLSCRLCETFHKIFYDMPAITQHQGRSDAFPFELVRPHLELVEVAIREQVRAFDPMVEPYVSYVCNTSGKRIRPALCVLTGGALGAANDDHRKMGVILELIHMATLVHDDLIDGATTRRIGFINRS